MYCGAWGPATASDHLIRSAACRRSVFHRSSPPSRAPGASDNPHTDGFGPLLSLGYVDGDALPFRQAHNAGALHTSGPSGSTTTWAICSTFKMRSQAKIARTLQFELTIADAGRLTEHLDVLDYLLRGRAAWWKSACGTNYAEALDLFERALALDPRAVEAQIWSAAMLIARVLDSANGYFHYDTPDVELQRADQLVAQALAVSPNSYFFSLTRARTRARAETKTRRFWLHDNRR